MRSSGFSSILTLSVVVAAAAPAPAQQPRRSHDAYFAWEAAPAEAAGAGRAVVASALLPGAGQWLHGEDRWVAYTAIELGGWVYYLNRRFRGDDLARAYRDLAWSAARAGSMGPRRDGDFEYYESLLHYASSGAYDVDPARPGVQPEREAATFNGSVWELARSIYIPGGEPDAPVGSPGYDEALAYYRQHAVPPELAWNWAGQAAARRRYADLIDGSDRAVRRATLALGVILANHLISAVDALVTARLSDAGTEPPVGIESHIGSTGGAPRWFAAVRVVLPTR